jgi:hypothetical protein
MTMPHRSSLLLIVLAVALAGCGGAPKPAAKSEPPACPEGTPSITARDVIGDTPKGYVVVEGDPVVIERVADQMKQTMGSAYRDHDARVLARRGARMGTAVMVFNAKERIPPPDVLVGQQQAAEERAGITGETIAVGSVDGRLRQSPDGSWNVVAAAGPCAMVLLASDREALLRDAATLVENAG